ncbi:neurogenic locus notch homolog protein 2-like isoform X2 [Actinia tenebrosa]|nr:neurogenic locus notch homolog protein 2-like isoform X2 [Actinia tenebrosa]
MKFDLTIQGKALRNHVSSSDFATDESHCKVKCFLDSRCISYNFGSGADGQGYVCELSHSDHIMHPDDLVNRTNTIYVRAQNSCNCSQNMICRFDFVDNTHQCDCFPGFTGSDCKTDIYECASNPCQNGGSCQDQVNGYVCTCVTGFTGTICETNIDDCAINRCQNNGTCIDLINDYNCSCIYPYSGRNCMTRKGWTECIIKSGEDCIGSKDDKYATFECHKGHVIAFKLIYVSGDGLSYTGQKNDRGYWGGTNAGKSSLQIHITEDKEENGRVAPPSNLIALDTILRIGIMAYSLPGVTNMDPELVFPDFVPAMPLDKDTKFRIWFGSDLSSIGEKNNIGQTCVRVEVLYE